ncbi:MAG: hypothetical protein ACYSVY_23420 [Planctomycetota bacterium]
MKTLVLDTQFPCQYKVVWDGRDSSGRHVASGLYLCRYQTGGFRSVNKMLLLK